jgi:hypothetical protein
MGTLLPQFPEIITVSPVCGILSPKTAGFINSTGFEYALVSVPPLPIPEFSCDSSGSCDISLHVLYPIAFVALPMN